MVGSVVVSDLVRRLRARPALVMTALLVLLSGWEIASLAQVKAAAATDADWKAASAYVRSEHRPGQDLVVFAPAWVDPVGRQWLGDLLSPGDLGRMDAARYARIWEVSIRGADAPETRGLGAPRLEKQLGALRVRRFEQTPAQVSWSVHAQGEVQEVAHRPRKCLRGLGRKQFPGVTLGNELQVYIGLADVWARKENQAFARLRVLIDGQQVGEVSIGNDHGWHRLAPIVTTPGPHEVTFDVAEDDQRSDSLHARLDVCLAAEARTR